MDEFELTNFQQVEKLLNQRFIFDEPFGVLVVPPRNDGMIDFLDTTHWNRLFDNNPHFTELVYSLSD